jgi:hypothetical protein
MKDEFPPDEDWGIDPSCIGCHLGICTLSHDLGPDYIEDSDDEDEDDR